MHAPYNVKKSRDINGQICGKYRSSPLVKKVQWTEMSVQFTSIFKQEMSEIVEDALERS
jgi:hypothetical protein